MSGLVRGEQDTPSLLQGTEERAPCRSQTTEHELVSGIPGLGEIPHCHPKGTGKPRALQGRAPTMASSCSEWGGRGGFWPTVPRGGGSDQHFSGWFENQEKAEGFRLRKERAQNDPYIT